MKFSLSIPNPEAWIIDHKDELEINWSDKAVSLHLNKENSFNLYLLDDEITIGMLIGHFLYQDREVSEFEFYTLQFYLCIETKALEKRY